MLGDLRRRSLDADRRAEIDRQLDTRACAPPGTARRRRSCRRGCRPSGNRRRRSSAAGAPHRASRASEIRHCRNAAAGGILSIRSLSNGRKLGRLFMPAIPARGLLVALPVDPAEIIGDRNLRRRGQIGEAHRRAAPASCGGRAGNRCNRDARPPPSSPRAAPWRRARRVGDDPLDHPLVRAAARSRRDRNACRTTSTSRRISARLTAVPLIIARLVDRLLEIFADRHRIDQHGCRARHRPSPASARPGSCR